MYKLNNIDDIMMWWMEELPTEELTSFLAKEIIENYRNGHINVVEALEELENKCSEDMNEYIENNKEIKKDLKSIKKG